MLISLLKDMLNCRNKSIDILRGLLMILVVIGHIGTPVTSFIYSFHVAAFFVLSGYLYKPFSDEASMRDFGERIKKRIKRLYIPCFLFSLFIVMMNNVIMRMGLYTTTELLESNPAINGVSVSTYYNTEDYVINVLKCLYLGGGSNLSGALWFLQRLFCSLLIFDSINYIWRKKNKSKTYIFLTSLLFFFIGITFNYWGIHLPMGLESMCTIQIFFIIGGEIHKMIQKYNVGRTKNAYLVVVAMITGGLLFFLSSIGAVNIGTNEYRNPILMLFTTCLGFTMLYTMSIVFSKQKYVSRILSYIGEHTIAILCWHFLAFKVVTWVIVECNHLDAIELAAFPVISWHYWIAYTLAGIVIPLFLVVVNNNLKICINHLRK